MPETFAIQIRPSWKPESLAFVRVYQNQREWVVRAHAKTATKFATQESAQAIVDKFNLSETHKASIIKVC